MAIHLEISRRIADKIAALFNGDTAHGKSIAAIIDAEIRPLITVLGRVSTFVLDPEDNGQLARDLQREIETVVGAALGLTTTPQSTINPPLPAAQKETVH